MQNQTGCVRQYAHYLDSRISCSFCNLHSIKHISSLPTAGRGATNLDHVHFMSVDCHGRHRYFCSICNCHGSKQNRAQASMGSSSASAPSLEATASAPSSPASSTSPHPNLWSCSSWCQPCLNGHGCVLSTTCVAVDRMGSVSSRISFFSHKPYP